MPQLYTLHGLPLLLPETATVDEWFRGKDDLQAIVKAALDAATVSVDVAMYNFTDPVLAQAIIAAKNRGLAVRCYLDRSNASQQSSQARVLVAAGVVCRISSNHYISHNKLCLIDGKAVFGGSFNWTPRAELHNDENLTRTDSPAVYAQYEAEYDELWGEYDPALTASLATPLPAK
jgi:phosphatidylserine/phosphatidylglycerophosphate/cardiolipin synthase-like enzyme